MTSEPITTLVADPPWPFADKLPGGGRGAVKHYATMKIPEIMRFPLPELAPDARLFLWRVGSMQAEALEVARAWGFVVKTELVWVKADTTRRAPLDRWLIGDRRRALSWSIVMLADAAGVLAKEARAVERRAALDGEGIWSESDPNHVALLRVLRALAEGEREREAKQPKVRIGMGRQVRNAHEVCLVATRGRPERLDMSTPSVFFAPRLAHSAKPDEFYELVERLSPGPFAELFARRERDGWATFGDELEEAHP